MSRTTEAAIPGAWLSVEHAVEAFERDHARSGQADPTTFCPPPGDPLRLQIVEELVRVDLEFSRQDGRSRRLEDYRAVFPDLFEDKVALAEVAFEEYRLRRQAGEDVHPHDYQTAYGIDPSSWPDGPGGSLLTRRSWPRTAAAETFDRTTFPGIGDEVVGFRLLRLLGQGAFAHVYQAEQADLAGRHVALKLSTQLVAEAGTLARLQHTNIVPIYSVHQVGLLQAICMPYLGPTTLADVLRHVRSLPSLPTDSRELARLVAGESAPNSHSWVQALDQRSYVETVLWIASELADGLAHAHERGIIHRDLKPANVLLSDEGRPMLLDFNLAADPSAGDLAAGFVGGTLSHMAPEQLAALAGLPAAVDARSDLYALGLVLHELLTGQPPHPLPSDRSHQAIEHLRKARSAPPPSARLGNPAVTPAIQAILTKTLAPDPAQRYQNARQLREDLLLQLSHRPLKHVREPSARERARKALRRNPWVKSVPFVAGLVTVVAAVGLAAFAYRGRQLEVTRADLALASFRQKAEQARPLLVLPEPDHRDLANGLALGLEALNTYVPESLDRWDAAAALRHRSPAERQSLEIELGELAFLLAEAEHRRASRAPDPEASRPILGSALRLNRVAHTLLREDPTRGPYVRLQGERLDGTSASRNAPQADLDPARNPSEEFWLRIAELDRRREFHQALELLRQREPERGGSMAYWRTRAEHHAAIADWSGAQAAFTTALALSPRPDADLLGRRGAARLALKAYRAAWEDYEAALRLEPEDAVLLRDRAQAKLGLGDTQGALADLNQAASLDPAHTRVHFMRARVHTRAGDRRAASEALQTGHSQAPGDELSWIARGLARMARDPEGAIADFDGALRQNPESRQALQNKASVLSERLGRPDEAVAVLDRLIELHPEYVPARAGRGVLLARLGRREAALADAAVALALSQEPFNRYQVAGIFALTSRTHPDDRPEALRLLASALRDKEGLALVSTDPDLEALRGDPGLNRILEAARALEETAAPRASPSATRPGPQANSP